MVVFQRGQSRIGGSTYFPLDLKALAERGPSLGVRTVDSETRYLLARSLVAGTARESEADQARGEG